MILLAGDFLAVVVITLVGFAFHQGIAEAGLRIFTTFIPLLVGWALAGPVLGVYDLERARRPRQLWRPVWAMLLAGPTAAWLRGVMLGNAAIIPIFVLVLTGMGMLGMLIWRALFIWIGRRFHSKRG
jgi:hypothetical protein